MNPAPGLSCPDHSGSPNYAGTAQIYSLSPVIAPTIENSPIPTDPVVLPEMLRKASTKIFPMHLAPIDAFFRTDDRPHHPMTSVIQMEFAGQLGRAAFESALDEAILRHPLLGALIRPAKRNELCWVDAGPVRPLLDWDDANVPVQCPKGEYINLAEEVGLRLWVRVGGGRSQLTVQVHHACTDGTGVYRFLGDLLALYGIRTGSGGDCPKMTRLDPTLLKNRRRKMARVAIQGTAWQGIVSAVREGYDVFGKRLAPLALPTLDSEPSAPFPGICTVEFDAFEHQALRQAAAHQGAMVNDLLLAEMFRTIVQWNAEHSRRTGNPWIRIMMPFDLRDQHDYEMPAANMTAYTFLSRRRMDCLDRKRLLRELRDETARIKCGNHGTTFVDALMVANVIPGIVPFLLRLNRCIATVTLSNVGDPSKRFTATFPRERGRVVCGDVVMEGVRGVPPLRQKMHATLAIFSYVRKLTICVRCDRQAFSISQTQRFLDAYARGLRSHVAALGSDSMKAAS